MRLPLIVPSVTLCRANHVGLCGCKSAVTELMTFTFLLPCEALPKCVVVTSKMGIGSKVLQYVDNILAKPPLSHLLNRSVILFLMLVLADSCCSLCMLCNR